MFSEGLQILEHPLDRYVLGPRPSPETRNVGIMSMASRMDPTAPISIARVMVIAQVVH